jgi:hypothetical protein
MFPKGLRGVERSGDCVRRPSRGAKWCYCLNQEWPGLKDLQDFGVLVFAIIFEIKGAFLRK